MVPKLIAYKESHGKQKSCATAIWTSFGPHALFHACLDLKRSNLRPSVVAAMPLRSSCLEPRVLRTRARSNPPCQFLVQDEEKGLLILQPDPPSCQLLPRDELIPPL